MTWLIFLVNSAGSHHTHSHSSVACVHYLSVFCLPPVCFTSSALFACVPLSSHDNQLLLHFQRFKPRQYSFVCLLWSPFSLVSIINKQMHSFLYLLILLSLSPHIAFLYLVMLPNPILSLSRSLLHPFLPFVPSPLLHSESCYTRHQTTQAGSVLAMSSISARPPISTRLPHLTWPYITSSMARVCSYCVTTTWMETTMNIGYTS